MKKIFFMMTILSSLAFGLDLKIKSEIPEEIERNINSALVSSSGSERRENFEWYKDSYLTMIKRLDATNIPQPDKERILRKLSAMYGGNYPKQLASLKYEIDEYNNLVAKITEAKNIELQKVRKENEKNKGEIQEILENTPLGERDLLAISMNAKKAYPENYSMQKAYIQGSIQAYMELKKYIKK